MDRVTGSNSAHSHRFCAPRAPVHDALVARNKSQKPVATSNLPILCIASYSPPCEEKKSFFFFLPANPRSAPPPPPPGYSPRPASPRRFGSLEGWHTGSATSGDGVLLSPWGRVSGAGRCAGEVEIDLLAGRRRRRLFFAGCIR
ncbi:hypothetical protein DAI22_09g062000 [Oryza sativa Japonica Group]|nr:hypothetical protein DAI22_09g062000 [Oryza sativa Japonica Group]